MFYFTCNILRNLMSINIFCVGLHFTILSYCGCPYLSCIKHSSPSVLEMTTVCSSAVRAVIQYSMNLLLKRNKKLPLNRYFILNTFKISINYNHHGIKLTCELINAFFHNYYSMELN